MGNGKWAKTATLFDGCLCVSLMRSIDSFAIFIFFYLSSLGVAADGNLKNRKNGENIHRNLEKLIKNLFLSSEKQICE